MKVNRRPHNKGKQYLHGVGYVKNREVTRQRIAIVVGSFLLSPILLRGAFNFRSDLAATAQASEQVELISPIPTSSPVLEATPSAEVVYEIPGSKWEEFVQAVDKVAPIYSFPKNVVLAQGALESNHGKSRFAIERNNFLGINARDANPDDAYSFDNAEQCVIEYMRIIRKNFPEAWATRDNPEELLHKLKVNNKKMMYATDPNYETKVKSMKEWNY